MRSVRPVDPLARHRVPSPPPELASEVLAAAAMVHATPRCPSWADRLWESAAARWLWMSATAFLLIANVVVARLPALPDSPPSMLVQVTNTRLDELAELIDLRVMSVELARRAVTSNGGAAKWQRQLAALDDSPREVNR